MAGAAPARARRRFGQNFLVDEQIIAGVVDALDPRAGQNLVEIGPGRAALTRPVLERAQSLTAIELDRDLVEFLRHDPFLKGLRLIAGDALKLDFTALSGKGELRVFGSLPYNITSPLIFHLLSQPGISDMHFMLQKEVVERLTASPGGRDYGRLTVMAGFYAETSSLMEVPPTAFRPVPKVTSALARLLPRRLSAEERALAPYLNTVTTAAFGARRKTLRNALSRLFSEPELEAAGVDPRSRAEELPRARYTALAALLRERAAA